MKKVFKSITVFLITTVVYLGYFQSYTDGFYISHDLASEDNNYYAKVFTIENGLVKDGWKLGYEGDKHKGEETIINVYSEGEWGYCSVLVDGEFYEYADMNKVQRFIYSIIYYINNN